MRPFDWRRDCPRDVARPFPAVVGRGRGVVIPRADASTFATGLAFVRASQLPGSYSGRRLDA